MSETDSEKRLIKSAYGVLSRLRRNLAPAYVLKEDVEEMIVIAALQQHGEHLKVHQIEQKTIDAFKLVCWLGGSLLEVEKDSDVNCAAVIDAMLKTLGYLLVYESDYWLRMSSDCQALLKNFLLQERCGNPNHGIWMNGLYWSFHCPLSTWEHGKKTRTPAM